jgi:ribosomal protein L11 methyltransferase
MTMARYLSLTCDLPPDLEEQLAETLGLFSVLGCSIEENKDAMVVTVYLESGRSNEVRRLAASLGDLGAASIHLTTIRSRDWISAYRSLACPFPVGTKWWIDPDPRSTAPTPVDRRRLVVEPSFAFGSGSHESTQLLLEELEDLPVQGATVLDVGTGSGILALAADVLGARRVIGTDIDPLAAWTALRTSRQQDWDVRAVFLAAPLEGLGRIQFELILCNMLTSEFTPLLTEFRRLLAQDGQLLISGSIRSEIVFVRSALESARLCVCRERRRGEWTSVRAAHA